MDWEVWRLKVLPTDRQEPFQSHTMKTKPQKCLTPAMYPKHFQSLIPRIVNPQRVRLQNLVVIGTVLEVREKT